ncbi:hypothetical protein ACFZBP_34355 [Streptomyces sp. NPDC008086]|uniref:hypothetical protein n=1 Tax=Streptomyces sp. NPDC008086 TaxID=3364807 RepID=UPI0036E34032
MTEHLATEDDRLPDATAHLVTVFEHLRAEHEALVAEAEETAAQERRGTMNEWSSASPRPPTP